MAHVVLEKAIAGHNLTHEVVVLVEDLFSFILKVALKEAVPEEEKHGSVQGKGPVEVRNKVRGGVQDTLVDGFGRGPRECQSGWFSHRSRAYYRSEREHTDAMNPHLGWSR